jgi:transcriptional regulator with XRE-family HTH domain
VDGDYMSIGSRILEARTLKNLTQEELASRVGITKGAIANYENGVSTPRIEIMLKLFDVLECDANFLYQDDMSFTTRASSATSVEYLTNHGNEKAKSVEYRMLAKDEAELIGVYHSLNSSGKTLLLQTARSFAGNPGMTEEEHGSSAM